MNKAYKVVFNKLRGTMMVVNEATSSIQKKGTKTVVATAVAAVIAGVSGTAMAEEAEVIDPVATVGSVTYDSLKAALDNTAVGGTVVLIKDIADQTGLSFGQSGASKKDPVKSVAKNVTVNLKGHTLTFAKDPSSGSVGYETQGVHMEKSAESMTFENGTVIFDGTNAPELKMGFQNYVNLRLSGVTLDGTKLNPSDVGFYTLSNCHGNTTITDSTILAHEGGVAFDVWYSSGTYSDGVSVWVENSTISGKIEVDTKVDNIGQNHKLTLIGGQLLANKSEKGGKIYTNGYTTIKSTKLDGNTASDCGGAIYNFGSENRAGDLTIVNVSFTNNTAGNKGGAIYNTGTLTLQGKNHFEGNTAAGKLNDIYNAGTLNISGDLTLNGGIVNSDSGTVKFTDKTTITTILTGDAIQNGSYALIKGGNIVGLDDDNVKLAENAIYNIAWDKNAQGTITVELKSANEIADSLPVTSQQAGTVAAILPTVASGSAPEQVTAIANAISIQAQYGNGDTVAQIAEDLAPSTAPVVSSVSQGVNNAIAGVANARMAANRAAGDVFTGGSAWAQMIYNSADQDATKKTAKLESDTYGITVGIDGKIGDNLTIGAGFGVTKTDAESGTRDIDVDSYALFGYTEYNADNGWFVNGMVNAIRGRYEENKTPAGIKLTAKYQTTVLGAGVATGYHFENGISPEVGLRYLRTHQGSYNDGAQKIHTDGTNLLTASIGAKYEKAFEQGDWVLKPSARVAATYDVVSDDTESAIRVIGGGQYHVISAHQKRTAYEAGLGLEASNGDWDFSVSYNGEFRSHFQSHTGMLKAKYNF